MIHGADGPADGRRDRSERSRGATEIWVEDLHRSFRSHRVLEGISLAINRGELVAIVGPSGCGKTVLLEHVIGSLVPDRGRVLVADHETPGSPLVDLATLDERAMDHLRRHWAIVFQRNALFTGTVYENCALWLEEVKRLPEEAIVPRVADALQAVDLDFEDVGRVSRDELSGGMAKRVAIARAIAMEPMLMFYDEPTTGLDPRLATQIHELIGRTHDGHRMGSTRTTVIITHDKDLLTYLQPRVILLSGGRVVFDGSFGSFERSTLPSVRPYFERMPTWHRRSGPIE